MARTLDQIISELNPTYKPQIESLRKRAGMIPDQIRTEEGALGAKKNEAFDSIVSGARRRGLGFSGIPLGEQAEYSATEYLPALARLRQSGREQAMSLQDAILGINERRDTMAQQIYQTEQDRAAQERQAAASRAAQQRAQAMPSLGALMAQQGGGGQQQAQQPKAIAMRRQDGGFNFNDAQGNAISAARYAELNNEDIRDVLYDMGQQGDQYAGQVYRQMRADPMFGKGDAEYDRRYFRMYRPLFWGIE